MKIEDITEQNPSWKTKQIEIFIFPRDRSRNDIIEKIIETVI